MSKNTKKSGIGKTHSYDVKKTQKMEYEGEEMVIQVKSAEPIKTKREGEGEGHKEW